MIICQTVSMEIRTGTAELPSARMMSEYLGKRYCGPSLAQIFILYQTVSSLQQCDDTVDRFYSRFCSLWRQIDLLTPVECPVAAAHSVTCTGTCDLRRRHEETRRMYDFIMRLR